MLKKLFRFLLFSHLFIAGCAVLMAAGTYRLFRLPFSVPYGGFVFFGTLCSYGFHWYLTPAVQSGSEKVRWTLKNKTVHFFLFMAGLTGSAFYLWSLHKHWPLLLSAAFITFLYSAPKIPAPPFIHLKKIIVGKTILLAFVWMYVTAALPLFIASVPWQTAHYAYCVNRFFLIYSICILFDYRDREQDKKEGIRSMITQFHDAGIDFLFWGSLAVFFITTLILFFYGFSLTQVAMVLLPGLITAFLYAPAKRNFSDTLYYFVLDGLMALSAVLLLLM